MKDRIVPIGINQLDHALKFECREFDETGEWLDTKVFWAYDLERVEGWSFVMWIAGADIDRFVEAWKSLYKRMAI